MLKKYEFKIKCVVEKEIEIMAIDEKQARKTAMSIINAILSEKFVVLKQEIVK